jgi:hypothetical protein
LLLVTSSIVTVVVTLVVALHLAAIIDVALMPAWAWRGAADAPKRRWVVLLALVPGWAIVYYRSADRREVRNHLCRCGGVEPDWHAQTPHQTRSVSVLEGAVAARKDRQLVRQVLAPGTDLVPIHWHAGPVAVPRSGTGRAPTAPRALGRAPEPAPGRGELLPPIRWYADEHEPRALPAPKRHLRLTA